MIGTALYRALHNKRGNAYLFVVIAVLMITALAGAVLTVTAAGRRTSERYKHFEGLYDLAVAGNEQAFFALQDALHAALALLDNEDDYENDNPDPADIITILRPVAQAASRPWQVTVLNEDFIGVTTVTELNPSGLIFRIQTEVYRASNWPVTRVKTTVRADIEILDGNTLRMVHSRRITN
jgi:hypothetical protein